MILMSECTHNCSTCGADCASRQQEKQSLIEKPHELSKIKKVIAVMSGKGGVGKSLTTALLAVSMQRRGFKTAILDADITGPSIPKLFGLNSKAESDGKSIFPVPTKSGIKTMSINLLLNNVDDPVVWRGPVIAGAVKQFWTDVIWDDVDYMFVDMPPGTGDVPLTVFQSLPIDGIVVVTSPQDLVSLIVTKAVKMAGLMDIPILGVVENYSYLECPDCKKQIKVFGESHIDEIAKRFDLDVLAKMPINPDYAKLCDDGLIELFEGDVLENACDIIEKN